MAVEEWRGIVRPAISQPVVCKALCYCGGKQCLNGPTETDIATKQH